MVYAEMNLEQLRLRLLELGYNSPFITAIALASATSTEFSPHDIIHTWSVNGEMVSQRADGKIDATAMCRVYKKTITDWLRTDDTWELFATREKELSLNFNYAY